MTEESWRPQFRIPTSTVTKILRSHAFLHSRERAATIADSPRELRALADLVEDLDLASAPLAAVADRVAAAVRFLRARADRLEAAPDGRASNAGVATKERLVVAGLHYLVTPVDLVPDFQAGGYIDDVFLLAWVFGSASHELAPHLGDDLADEEPAPGVLED